jgi:histone deacetylase 6
MTARLPLKSLPDTCGTTTLSELYPRKLVVIGLTSYHSANEATEVFLLGVGNAFFGVANLLINRGRAN